MRPQFARQIQILNKRIFKRVKPKKINGRFLDGTLLLDLCQSYQKAINEGSVPNIESAWNCLCQNETLKAFKEAENTMDRKIEEF